MIDSSSRIGRSRTCPSGPMRCPMNAMPKRSVSCLASAPSPKLHRSLGAIAALLAAGTLAAGALAACDQSGSAVAAQLPTASMPTAAGPGAVPVAEATPLMAPHACGARIKELAIFQAVKVPLVVEGEPVATLTAPLIEGRRAFFRAYIAFDDSGVRGNARAHLRLASSLGQWNVPADTYLGQDSVEGDVNSTVNFDVPADLMRGDVRVGVDLELGSGCNGGSTKSYPTNGLLPLSLQNTGVMKVTLVPVLYDADKSSRPPDTSPAQLASYRDVLMAYYPIADVQITVREPVHSDIALSAGGGWSRFLNAIAAQRDADKVPSDVHYYALVSPAKDFRSYCSMSCIAGLSYLADVPSSGKQVGAGIGFPGTDAGDTMAHELGHQHGRGHAPCGAMDGLDPRYPTFDTYAGAGLGSWGLDFRSGKLQSPTRSKDLMSYCTPIWISDYTYGLLAIRRLAITQGATPRVIDAAPDGLEKPHFRGFRSLLAEPDGRPVWGRPITDRGQPVGTPEIARALDAQGKVVAEVTVYRTSYGDGAAGSSIEVPQPAAGWASLQVAGQSAISFAAEPVVPALRPM